MPEIGMGKGAGVGSFAAGFGKGLSNALLRNRQRSDEKAQEERARKDRLFQTMLPVMLQNMEDPADLQPLLESQFPDVFTQAKKGGKKGESPWDKLAGFLGPMVGIHKRPMGNDLPEQGGISGMLGREPGPFGTQPTSVGASPLGGALPPSTQPTGVSGGTLGNRPVYEAQQGQVADVPPDISQTALAPGAKPATPAAPAHRTLFGVPILSREERAQRDADAETAKMKREIEARRSIAAELYPNDPARSVDYALYGTRPPAASVGSTAITPSSLFEDYLKQKAREKGAPLDASETLKARKEWEAQNDPVGTKANEFEQYLQSYATSKHKDVEHLTADERLEARNKFAQAGSTRPEAVGNDTDALARLAVRNPTVLQGLTPTVTGGVLAAIAKDPQLRAQYETTRMEPIRAQAKTIVKAIDDLVRVDKAGNVVGLTPGAMTIFGGTKAFGALGWYPGSAAAEAQSALDQVTGQQVLDTLGAMKAQSRTGATGFGQLNLRELQTIEAATTRLKGGITEEKAVELLKDLREKFGKVDLPSEGELYASSAQGGVKGPITLDTPVYIGMDGKPSLAPPR